MGQVFTVDNEKMYKPMMERYAISNTGSERAEGPISYQQLSDTLSFFSSPNAPKPFLFVKVTNSDFVLSPGWRSIAKDANGVPLVSTFRTKVFIKDNSNNTSDYVCLGDVFLPGNMKPDDNNVMLLFAHKKIVVKVPSTIIYSTTQNKKELEYIAIGDTNKASPAIRDLYVAVGCSASITNNQEGKTTLPVVLRAFLKMSSNQKRLFAYPAQNSTENRIIEFKFAWQTIGNPSITDVSNQIFANTITSASNMVPYTIPNLTADEIISRNNSYIFLNDINAVVNNLTSVLLSGGVFNYDIYMQMGLWSDAKALTLATAVCNSTVDTGPRPFCACLGRKNVQQKLQSVIKNPDVKMACVSKACQEAVSGSGVFKIPFLVEKCTTVQACLKEAEEIAPAVISGFGKACPAMTGATSTLRGSKSSYEMSCVPNTGMLAVLLLLVIFVGAYFMTKKEK